MYHASLEAAQAAHKRGRHEPGLCEKTSTHHTLVLPACRLHARPLKSPATLKKVPNRILRLEDILGDYVS